jgi:hypothetical protein
MAHHYVVAQQDKAWQFSFKGDVTGPFTSREEAVEEAIAAAQRSGDQDVEVMVRDAELNSQTVWKPGTPA